MLALVLGPAPRVVHDQPEPVRGPGEALLRVRVAGVCDTDLQLARGYMGFTGVPGHECVAEVLASDDGRWRGKRVVADINAGCGRCAECLARGGHHCPTRTVLGIVGRPGAFAERVTIPEACLVPLPDAVSDDAAVFAEPLAAALHVLDEVPKVDAPRPRVLVLGDGKLGLLIALALHGEGVETTLVGHHPSKLAVAKAVGVETFLESDLPPSRKGAPMVVEATGSEGGFSLALAAVAPRGTVILKTTVAAKLTVDLAPVVIHELRVVGSRCGDLARAVAALEAGRVNPLPLVEARYPLARADEALAHAGRRGARKILLNCRV